MLEGETVVFGCFLAEFALLTVLGFAAAFAASAVSGKYSVLVSARYRRQVAWKLYQVEYSYFDGHSSASVINKVNADLNEAERFLGETFVMLVGGRRRRCRLCGLCEAAQRAAFFTDAGMLSAGAVDRQ